MASQKEMIDVKMQIFVTKSQHEKLKLIAFYSSKSMGELLRRAIDKFDVASYLREK